MPTDNQVDKLIINQLTKQQYETIVNPSSTELYVTEDLDIPLPDGAYTADNLVGGRNISLGATTYEKDVELDNDTIALFHFNGNYADSSKYAASGTYTPSTFSPKYASGKFDYAISATNTSSSGSITYKNDGFTSTDVFTLDWWEYVYSETNNTGFQYVFFNNAYSQYLRLKVFLSSGSMRIFSDSSAGSLYDDTCSALQANKWNHIAIQVKSGTSCDIFINGVLFTTITTNIPIFDHAEAWRLEVMQSGSYIDETRLSKVARYASAGYTVPAVPYGKEAVPATGINNELSSGEVINVTPNVEIDEHTKLLLHFDGDLEDSSMYASTCTRTKDNGTAWTLAANSPVYADGKFGKYVSSIYTSDGNTPPQWRNSVFADIKNSFTIDFWFNSSDTNSHFTICTKNTSNTQKKLLEVWNYQGTWRVSFFESSSASDVLTSFKGYAFNHFAITDISGGDAKLYINGSLAATRDTPYSFSSGLNAFALWTQNTQGGGAVAIDEFRVSDVVRYTDTFVPPAAPSGNNGAVINLDKSVASGLGMPSRNYSNITLSSSGTWYTAVANGWIFFSKAGNTGQYISIVKLYSTQSTYENSVMWASADSQSLYVWAPVRKGEQFRINYTAEGNTNFLRFIYAEGEK